LRYRLNETSESVGSLGYVGILFRTVGPDTLKARPPNVDSLKRRNDELVATGRP